MASSTSLRAAGSAALLETMKKAATVLRTAGLPFALAGGAAAYARGAAPPLHHADFADALTSVRPMREQVDWDRVRRETSGSAFARAFLVLLEGLGVIGGPGAEPGTGDPGYLAGRIERALAEDPRTHELGVCV